MSKPSLGAHARLARGAAPVVDAVREVQADHPVDRVQLVADAQRDDRGQVAARRLAADQQPVGAELGRAELEQLACDGDTVVGAGRPRELRRLAVLDRHDHDAVLAGEHLVRDVHHRGRARDHPTAVEVEIDGARSHRRDAGPGTATPPIVRSSASGSGERHRAHRRARRRDLLVTRQVGRRLRVEHHRRTTRLDHRPRLRAHRLDLVRPQLQRPHAYPYAPPAASAARRARRAGRSGRTARPDRRKMLSDLDRDREDDRRVPLGRDLGHRLQRPELHRARVLGHRGRRRRRASPMPGTHRRRRSPSHAAHARLRPGAPSPAASARAGRRRGSRRGRPARPTPPSARRARS